MIMTIARPEGPKFETQKVQAILDSVKTSNFLGHYQHKLRAQNFAPQSYRDSVDDNGQLTVTVELED